MPKATENFSSPRRLFLSWRRPEGEAYSNVRRFLDRLKDRMRLDCDHITLLDREEAGGNLAEQRPESWTDFLAVWTLHYGLTCKDAASKGIDGHELHRFLHHLSEGPKQGWVAKLEDGFDREAQTGSLKPWKRGRWYELPDQTGAIFPTASNKKEKLDKLIAEAIKRIRDNPPVDSAVIETVDDAMPVPDPPQADAALGSSLSLLSKRLLGRNH